MRIKIACVLVKWKLWWMGAIFPCKTLFVLPLPSIACETRFCRMNNSYFSYSTFPQIKRCKTKDRPLNVRFYIIEKKLLKWPFAHKRWFMKLNFHNLSNESVNIVEQSKLLITCSVIHTLQTNLLNADDNVERHVVRFLVTQHSLQTWPSSISSLESQRVLLFEMGVFKLQ